MSNYLLLLLILACPLMMIFMMRGMHGGRGDNADGDQARGHQMRSWGEPKSDAPDSLEELLKRRDELDREIEERKAAEQAAATPGAAR
jgi:hypothetical protein